MTGVAFSFTDRAYPLVEIGIGDIRSATGAAWDEGRWDTGRWAGIEPEWVDVSCDTRSSTIVYGRTALLDRFIAGGATIILDNESGWADPDTTDPPGVLSVRPGRPIRVSIVHAVHGAVVIFRGFIDAMTPRYPPGEPDTVELECLDALGEVNRARMAPVDPKVGDGDTGAERIHRILNAIGWVPRDIQPDSETLVASGLGGSVADLLAVAADSTGGSVFGDMDGRVAYRSRDWQTFSPDTPPDGTIGNVSGTPNRVTFGEFNYLEDGQQVVYGVAVGDVCPVQWVRPFDRNDIATRAIMGRDPETAVTVDDLDGIARYGIEPFERTDLLTANDDSLELLAERVLRVQGEDTAPRVRSVSLDAATSPEALDLMTTVDVYRPSRYRCRLEYPAPRGVVFDDEYLATGVAHTITRDYWSVELNLDVAAPFAAAGGRWDSSFWDQATWSDAVELIAEARELLEVLT